MIFVILGILIGFFVTRYTIQLINKKRRGVKQ